MKLTWLGHACFVLEHKDYRIVADPYLRAEGYPHMQTTAHECTFSHQHLDHFGPQRVELLPRRESPFTIYKVETFHDGEQGTLRGTNTIHVYEADGLRVAHLGDLGHVLNDKQVAEIGALDAVLIPVGGYYTIDAAAAKQVCQQLNPRVIIPMHYHHAPYGLSVVAGVEDFLALWEQAELHSMDTDTLELTDDLHGIWVPRYCEQ